MKTLLSLLKYIIGMIAALILHIGAAYVLPYPYAYVNALFAILILFLLLSENGAVVWMAFCALFIVELYATSAPFGAHLFAGTISMLLGYWLYQYMLTNRSWYSGIALTVMVLAMYRLLYSAVILARQMFGSAAALPWPQLAASFAWELALTSFVVGIASLIFFKSGFTRPARRRGVFSL
ncbi:MAG: hypothetical protein A3C90_03955 [Candidatus Magasanikbacteria bacterium RIFCSPHIGHO2_02_FULL_51_14]|uniref:Rod shape-determining protein MreD n=1 Tax=Candidatus Magasanikbacteria bacterium RIFCSPHIGHO2_02_FULL_51_14 TaxID=1798683 RepID=A0A1F6MNM8_9BACT|nr:MAG: hypothetical protein A3C90_03955 [Candidatus Magasanikbacteria bacterium RIFCSPHIGHO2_02_FULL_51_14]